MRQPRHRLAARRQPQSGATLVELLVALVIFALIGAAGFTLLDQVARVDRLTAGRVVRLEQMQRAMAVLSLDFATAQARSVASAPGGVSLQRGSDAAGTVTVRYFLQGGAMVRALDAGSGESMDQTALGGVGAANWLFLDGTGIWQSQWPPEGATVSLAAPQNPRAVAVTLVLAAGGSLRRVAVLPGTVE